MDVNTELSVIPKVVLPMLGTFINHVLNLIGIRIPCFSNVNVNNLLPGRPRYVIPDPIAMDPRIHTFFESGDTLQRRQTARDTLNDIVPELGTHFQRKQTARDTLNDIVPELGTRYLGGRKRSRRLRTRRKK